MDPYCLPYMYKLSNVKRRYAGRRQLSSVPEKGLIGGSRGCNN